MDYGRWKDGPLLAKMKQERKGSQLPGTNVQMGVRV